MCNPSQHRQHLPPLNHHCRHWLNAIEPAEDAGTPASVTLQKRNGCTAFSCRPASFTSWLRHDIRHLFGIETAWRDWCRQSTGTAADSTQVLCWFSIESPQISCRLDQTFDIQPPLNNHISMVIMHHILKTPPHRGLDFCLHSPSVDKWVFASSHVTGKNLIAGKNLKKTRLSWIKGFTWTLKAWKHIGLKKQIYYLFINKHARECHAKGSHYILPLALSNYLQQTVF